MKSYVISSYDDGQRLNRFLEKTVPSLYPSLMYKYLRLKRIKINGKRAYADTRLKRGDEITMYISDDFFDQQIKKEDYMGSDDDLRIIYEDRNIAILNKQAGLLSHSDITTDIDTLVNRFLKYLTEKKQYDPTIPSSFTPALCNRLDRYTSGIVVAAKNPVALREVNLMIKQRDMKKYYYTVVTAKPPKDGVYTAYLKNSEGNRVEIVSAANEGFKEILTSIQTIYMNGGLYVVQVELITGRKHQIRAHLAHLGCPVLGDDVYGNAKVNRNYHKGHQVLTSYMVSFELKDSIKDYKLLSYLDGRSYEIKNSLLDICSLVDSYDP